jgi:signal transduction protein with GAF and PtsI domain
VTDELIEAVAKAIRNNPVAARYDNSRNIARAALQAIDESGTHVVVPVEPTGEMGQAGENLDLVGLGSRPVYEAMLAARPKVPHG